MIDIQKLSTGQLLQNLRGYVIRVAAVYFQGGEWKVDIYWPDDPDPFHGVTNDDLNKGHWELTR